MNRYNKELLKVELVSKENSLSELIENCDLVAGYNTIALFEAKAAGKRAISLKVAKINNSLSRAMSDAGIEITGADTESIFSRLTEDSLVKADIKKFSGSIRNCVNVIMKELSLN
ncbi:MAG: hypothetical protein R2942_11350 [Ignavibacteria bacterium]